MRASTMGKQSGRAAVVFKCHKDPTPRKVRKEEKYLLEEEKSKRFRSTTSPLLLSALPLCIVFYNFRNEKLFSFDKLHFDVVTDFDDDEGTGGDRERMRIDF